MPGEDPAPEDPAARCRCRHGRLAHEHHRRASDCGVGGCPCARFSLRLPDRLRAALAMLRRGR